MEKTVYWFFFFLGVAALLSAQNPGYRVVAWGYYNSSSVNFPTDANYVAIAAGGSSSLALTTDGRVVAWGTGNYNVHVVPEELTVPNSCIGIAAGSNFRVALKSDGTLKAWGSSNWNVLNVPQSGPFIKVAAGGHSGLALKADHSIKAWGELTFAPSGTDFIDITCGLAFNAALRSNGTIIAWGNDGFGQLGCNGNTGNLDIDAGYYHILARKTNGSLVAWGAGELGEHGTFDYGQSICPPGNDFIAIAGGRFHSLALKSDGTLISWGIQDGSGSDHGVVTDTPTDGGYVAIDADELVSLALKRVCNVNVTSNPSGATILMNGSPTVWTTPHTFQLDYGSSATFSVQMDEYTWEPSNQPVSDIQSDTDIEFVGTHHNPPIVPGVSQTIGGPNFYIASVTVETPPDTGFDIDYDVVNINSISNVNNGLSYHNSYAVIFTGPDNEWFDLAVTVPAGIWWICAWYGGSWHTAVPDYPYIGDVPGTVYLMHVQFAGSKGQVIMIVAEGENLDPTLPVELSSFSAVVASNEQVSLAWVTQSETDLCGYYVFRNQSATLELAYEVSELIEATNTSQTAAYTFNDDEVEAGNCYYYWLQIIGMDGGLSYYGPISVSLEFPEPEDNPVVPLSAELLGAFPNPFNPYTMIKYRLPSPGSVQFHIYNAKGQVIRTYQQTYANSGIHYLYFDGTSEGGNNLSSGIYYCLMTYEKTRYIRKMVLMK
jgi:hypothetical protein